MTTRRGADRIRRFGLVLVVVVAGLVAAACLPTAAPGEPRIHLENASDDPVGLYVNGGWVGTYQPGATIAVPLFGRGGPPFDIEVRTITNEVLLDLPVTADDARTIASGSTTIASEAMLDCGFVSVAVGTVAPIVERGEAQGAGACP